MTTPPDLHAYYPRNDEYDDGKRERKNLTPCRLGPRFRMRRGLGFVRDAGNDLPSLGRTAGHGAGRDRRRTDNGRHRLELPRDDEPPSGPRRRIRIRIGGLRHRPRLPLRVVSCPCVRGDSVGERHGSGDSSALHAWRHFQFWFPLHVRRIRSMPGRHPPLRLRHSHRRCDLPQASAGVCRGHRFRRRLRSRHSRMFRGRRRETLGWHRRRRSGVRAHRSASRRADAEDRVAFALALCRLREHFPRFRRVRLPAQKIVRNHGRLARGVRPRLLPFGASPGAHAFGKRRRLAGIPCPPFRGWRRNRDSHLRYRQERHRARRGRPDGRHHVRGDLHRTRRQHLRREPSFVRDGRRRDTSRTLRPPQRRRVSVIRRIRDRRRLRPCSVPWAHRHRPDRRCLHGRRGNSLRLHLRRRVETVARRPYFVVHRHLRRRPVRCRPDPLHRA